MSLVFRVASLLSSARRAKGSLQKARTSAQKAQSTVRTLREAAVTRNLEKAQAGDCQAQYQMGERFYDGLGVAQDYSQAAAWFRAAAEKGHAKAQFNLGLLHYLGRGVPRNLEEAYRWLSLAMKGGYEPAAGARERVARKMTPAEITRSRVASGSTSAGSRRSSP